MYSIAKNCNVVGTDDLRADLSCLVTDYDAKQIFIVVDQGSRKFCYDLVRGVEKLSDSNVIEIRQGDDYKNYESALQIWNFLSEHGANRRSLLINIGGGMPCDLGGFCASTFKRGIEFINIPTTLLAQVDASIGGKTGMNLGGLKNEIGVFSIAKSVLICSDFLKTLDKANLLSGFAEMLKHALIHDAASLEKLLAFDFDKPDFGVLQTLVCESISIKKYFVTEDPKEKGVRKALNFGHTFGHAFETFAMRHQRPILHGYAVAYGMVCELRMSAAKVGLDRNEAERVAAEIEKRYGKFSYTENDLPELIELMTHDKKNDSRGINFTLLPRIGEIIIDQIIPANEIEAELRNYINVNSK